MGDPALNHPSTCWIVHEQENDRGPPTKVTSGILAQKRGQSGAGLRSLRPRHVAGPLVRHELTDDGAGDERWWMADL